MANLKIEEVEGIGPTHGTKLREAGVISTDELLAQGATPNGRRRLVENTGIESGRILQWVNMVDLFRVKGVGGEYAELLEASGVDTVKELRHRKPENLHARMEDVNATRKLTRKTPSLSEVTRWIEDASKLAPAVEH